MHARMTLVGMENLINQMSVTEDLSLADAFSEFDATDEDKHPLMFNSKTLLAAIILKGGQFEPLYTDPRFYYDMSYHWWNKWKYTFKKWIDVLEQQYNPLNDKDAHEIYFEKVADEGNTTNKQHTDNEYGEEFHNDDVTKNTTDHGDFDQVKTTTPTGKIQNETWDENNQASKGKDLTTHRVSAYDNSDLVIKDQTENETGLLKNGAGDVIGNQVDNKGHQKNVESYTDNYNVKEETKNTKDLLKFDENKSSDYNKFGYNNDKVSSSTNSNNNRNMNYERHQVGQFGAISTSQKLVNQELETRYWDIYEHISDIFLDEMTIRVY